MRVSATSAGTTTPYVWDRVGELPLLIDDGDMNYLHANGILAEIDQTNAASYHLADALGSVRGLTDSTGALSGTASYDAFGAVRSATGASSVFGFTGEQADPTGLTYLRARSMDPSLGRFLSMDTVQPNAPGTQGYNRYAYVANNPATWTDPSGHATKVDVCANLLETAMAAVWAFAQGIMVAKGPRTAYIVQIVAWTGTNMTLAQVLSLVPQSGPVPAIEGLLGANVLALGGLNIAAWYAGYGMSLPTGFGLLLAGVLLLLAAVMFGAITQIVDWYLGVSKAGCEKVFGASGSSNTSNGFSLPSVNGGYFTPGQTMSSVSSTILAPKLPTPLRPSNPSSTRSR